jgi:hypothetical protein
MNEPGAWYASLDVGPERYVSDPDFTGYGHSPEDAIRQSAAIIRRHRERIERHPYDLHFRYMRWWAQKEQEG